MGRVRNEGGAAEIGSKGEFGGCPAGIRTRVGADSKRWSREDGREVVGRFRSGPRPRPLPRPRSARPPAPARGGGGPEPEPPILASVRFACLGSNSYVCTVPLLNSALPQEYAAKLEEWSGAVRSGYREMAV